MGFHNCLCGRKPCVCGSDQEPPPMQFTPETFSMLLEKEQRWFGLLARVESPRARYMVLTERTRWLRN